ncbi:MAG: hypothetical protein OXN89_10585 [Bryobacterales bacterium]|nr:hypothetical protein [Bryobacterales bacterium]
MRTGVPAQAGMNTAAPPPRALNGHRERIRPTRHAKGDAQLLALCRRERVPIAAITSGRAWSFSSSTITASP